MKVKGKYKDQTDTSSSERPLYLVLSGEKKQEIDLVQSRINGIMERDNTVRPSFVSSHKLSVFVIDEESY